VPKLLSDYIKVYERTLPVQQCQAFIQRFEASPDLHEREETEGSYSFVQLNVTHHWKDVHEHVGKIMLTCIGQYHRSLDIGQYWPTHPMAEEIRLKRYLPGGRDSFPPHVDVMNDADSRRFITAILYLNDPGGGETIFSELSARITPAPGRLLIFPPLWLFPHAGLPPRDKPKYILHTYLWYPPMISDARGPPH
jgi:prolyl 4-hydroxylase